MKIVWNFLKLLKIGTMNDHLEFMLGSSNSEVFSLIDTKFQPEMAKEVKPNHRHRKYPYSIDLVKCKSSSRDLATRSIFPKKWRRHVKWHVIRALDDGTTCHTVLMPAAEFQKKKNEVFLLLFVGIVVYFYFAYLFKLYCYDNPLFWDYYYYFLVILCWFYGQSMSFWIDFSLLLSLKMLWYNWDDICYHLCKFFFSFWHISEECPSSCLRETWHVKKTMKLSWDLIPSWHSYVGFWVLTLERPNLPMWWKCQYNFVYIC